MALTEEEKRRKKSLGQRAGEATRTGVLGAARAVRRGAEAVGRVIGEPQEQAEQFYKSAFGSDDFQTTREYAKGLQPQPAVAPTAAIAQQSTVSPLAQQVQPSALEASNKSLLDKSRSATGRPATSTLGFAPKDRTLDQDMLSKLMDLNEQASKWSGNIGDPGQAAFMNPNRAVYAKLLGQQQKERLQGTFGDKARQASFLGGAQRQQQTASATLSQAQADAVEQASQAQSDFQKLFLENPARATELAKRKKELQSNAAFSIMD